jgi:replicative DNA helicase
VTLTPEEAVIGACLLDESVIREAVKIVMPSDFGSWQGEEVFTAIINLHSTKRPVDVITVMQELARMGSKVDPARLHVIIAEVPTAANVSFYAEQVREKATRARLTRIGQKLVQYGNDPAKMPGTVLAEALADLKAAREDSPMSTLKGKSMAEVMAEPDTYDWVIKGLLEEGDRIMVTADEGAGKSMLSFQFAHFCAAGIHPFWLWDIPPIDVVVFDRENSERRWRRKSRPMYEAARTLGKGDPGNIYVENAIYESFDITKDRDLGYLHRILDHHPAKLLILGPMYTLVPRAMNSDDDAAPVLAALNTLRERGTALFIEAHAGHSRSTDLHPVGSSAFLRWPEFGIGLRKDPTIPNRVTLERWRGDREDRSFPSALNRGTPNAPWIAEGASPQLIARINDPGAMFHEPKESPLVY